MGVEYGLVLLARAAAAGALLANIGLMAYGNGGYLFLVHSIELAYPLLDADRDSVLNSFLSLVGAGMFATSLPILLLEVNFNRDGLDYFRVLLTIVLGTVGLALVRLSVFKILWLPPGDDAGATNASVGMLILPRWRGERIAS